MSLKHARAFANAGGVLVATVWESFDLVKIAGGLTQAVTGPPKEPAKPNPCGPFGLADATLFDGLLKDANFAFTDDHNTVDRVEFILGTVHDENAFKMAALPIWDMLDGLAKGEVPDAWKKAEEAFPKVVEPYLDGDGKIQLVGTYRSVVVRK